METPGSSPFPPVSSGFPVVGLPFTSTPIHISRFVQLILGCFSIAGHLLSPAAMQFLHLPFSSSVLLEQSFQKWRMLPHHQHSPSLSYWGDWLFQNAQAIINRMLEDVSVAVSGISSSMG
jgi:hypothetical protein